MTLLYIFQKHLPPVQGQEQVTAEPVGSGIPKTASADRGHTGIQTPQGRRPVIKTTLLEHKWKTGIRAGRFKV